jgi:hypothetical protein
MIKVRVTDEFHTVWTFVSESIDEVAVVVDDWLKSYEITPIYEILIEIDPK